VPFAARSSAGLVVATAITAKLEVEGQAGAVLINDLNGDGVASGEYVQVARALSDSAHSAEALTYYKDALNAPPYDAETRATALRYLGVIYYNLDQPVTGHQYLMQAVKVFNGHPVEPRFYTVNSIAQAYLLDASHQVYIKGGCRIAARDKETAQNVIGSYAAAATVQHLTGELEDAYKSKCSGSV
jgi:tetratricopeptide (TPR) repeat protein